MIRMQILVSLSLALRKTAKFTFTGKSYFDSVKLAGNFSDKAMKTAVTAESTEIYFGTKCGPTPTVETIDEAETLVFKTYICTKLDEELSNGMITGVSCFVLFRNNSSD